MRYAVRQVLDQEYQKNIIVRANALRQARYHAGNPHTQDDAVLSLSSKALLGDERLLDTTKRDFFGRVVVSDGAQPLREIDGNAVGSRGGGKGEKVWVSYHEGYSNAVKKPITVEELLRGL